MCVCVCVASVSFIFLNFTTILLVLSSYIHDFVCIASCGIMTVDFFIICPSTTVVVFGAAAWQWRCNVGQGYGNDSGQGDGIGRGHRRGRDLQDRSMVVGKTNGIVKVAKGKKDGTGQGRGIGSVADGKKWKGKDLDMLYLDDKGEEQSSGTALQLRRSPLWERLGSCPHQTSYVRTPLYRHLVVYHKPANSGVVFARWMCQFLFHPSTGCNHLPANDSKGSNIASCS